MASFREYAEKILAGGLPALLDNPQASPVAQQAPTVEQTPPNPTRQDYEAFTLKDVLTPTNAALGVTALVLAGLLVWSIARR